MKSKTIESKRGSSHLRFLHGLSLLAGLVGVLLIACSGPETSPTSPAVRTDVVTVSPVALVRAIGVKRIRTAAGC